LKSIDLEITWMMRKNANAKIVGCAWLRFHNGNRMRNQVKTIPRTPFEGRHLNMFLGSAISFDQLDIKRTNI